jgi:hypothetical protein
MRPKLRWPALFMILVPAHACLAASATDKPAQLDQLDVNATRTLSELRREVVAAEDRFYAEYNELNDNDDFDVKCREDARTGTRLEVRICRAVYQEEAIREGAKEGLETMQCLRSNYGKCGAVNSPPVPAAVRIMALESDFQRNMR